jgi:hypothetical protein
MPLYIEQRASGWYRIRGTHHGESVDRSARTRSAGAAEKVREKIEREIFDRQVLGKAPPYSFAEAARDYMRGGGDGEFLEPIITKFGTRDVRNLKQADVDGLAVELYPEAKPSTRNRKVYTPFVAVMTYAANDGRREERRWRRPEQPAGRTDWRMPDEMEKILDALAPKARALATFYLGTFCRATEAVELEWKDVSPAAQRATFWETKGGYARHVDLIPRVREIMPQRPTDGQGAVFLTDRTLTPWHCYDAVNLALKRACKAVGAKPLSCHVLRHTGATWRYALTRDVTELMKVGGWKSPDMVFRYVHAGTDDLKAILQRSNWAKDGQRVKLKARK